MRFVPVYLANLFLSLHYAALLYVNSTFLGGFFRAGTVSALFLAAAVLNILLFIAIPRLIRKFGLKTVYRTFVVVAAGSLFGFAWADTFAEIAAYFIIYAGVLFMVYYCLDIFLEDITEERKTGEIRGSYLTLGNAAIAVGPLFLPLLVQGDDLLPVYALAIAILVPVFLLSMFFKNAKASTERMDEFTVLSVRSWWKADALRRATMAKLILEVFYALMVIYTPVYLRNVLGFEWGELGIMFAIMLLPFVLFEWPLGELADRLLGEKEIMTVGFFITGITLLAMPFLGPTFAIWTLILFISRIGASFVEIASESHFFRHVDGRDSSLISIFRLARPAGFILGTMIGAISLQFLSFEKIFFLVAVVVFLGLRQSLYLKDTL